MWREEASSCTATADGCRGFRPTPNRSFFTWSISKSSALSTMQARSPSGMRCWSGPLREFPDRGRNRRLRRQTRDQFLDLALRLAYRLGEDLALILGCQVRCEQAQSGQVDLP